MNTEFKLIAIRPLAGCEDYIRKCLSIGDTYYFSNDYNISEDGENIYFRDSNLKPLSNEFFLLEHTHNSSVPIINISAIVGKNGDGKSSIIELMIRLINNCALHYKFNTQNHDLLEVKGLKAALYYRINNEIFYLIEDNSNIAIYHIANIICKDNQQRIESTKRKLNANEVKKGFFYTMVSNYSHYAYNIYDFTREWNPDIIDKDDNKKCWLFKIFHKNDGYQTPLVLHPYRDKGNIDINTEKYLSNQRLLALFINAANPEKDSSSFRNINNQYADLLLLKDLKYSKLQDKIIKEYFDDVKDKSVLDSIIKNIDDIITEIQAAINKYKTDINIDNSYLKDFSKDFLDPLNKIWKKIIEPNIDTFDAILKWIPKLKKDDLAKTKTDLAIFLNSLETLSTLLEQENKKNKINLGSDIITNIKAVINNYSKNSYFSFNILQIQRIDLIDHICDIWRGKKMDINLEDYAFDLTNEILIKDYKLLSLLEKSYHYIIYKTIQILDRYPNYDDSCYGFNNLALAFESQNRLKEASESVNKGFITLFKDLIKDKSHITLKLRQSLNFKIELLENKDIYRTIEQNTFSKYNESIKGILIEQEEGFQASPNLDNSNYIVLSLDELKKYYNKKVIELDQLPPPIFQSDVYLKHSEDKERYTPLSALSSGEKQMLNSISSIVYHLQNINSVPKYGLVNYSFVNLVLEEIELYFHPEYQRSFIKSLLDLIFSANLTKIKGINIIFVTHSPFILSDIPKRNVLFLEGGKPTDKMQENTFGANIHSLLKNGFFLDTLPIGAFAHSKINTLFAKLNSGDFSDAEFEHMYQDILLVGEPYLRGQLLSLYNSYKLPKTDFEKEQIYTERISEIESKLLDLDKQVNKVKNDKSK